MTQTTIDGHPGAEDWRMFVRRFIDELVATEDSVRLRTAEVALAAIRAMPFALVGDAAYHGVQPFVRKDFKKRVDLIGIPIEEDDGGGKASEIIFCRYEQLELPEAIAWAQADWDRRRSDVAASHVAMARIVEAHPEWNLTIRSFCAMAGVPVP